MEPKNEKQNQIKGKLECDVCKREFIFSNYICDECKRDLNKKSSINYKQEIDVRINSFGYPILILLFIGISYIIMTDFGWGISLFTFILETVILELSYRLSQK